MGHLPGVSFPLDLPVLCFPGEVMGSPSDRMSDGVFFWKAIP